VQRITAKAQAFSFRCLSWCFAILVTMVSTA